jgi:hypothetical protein
MRNLDPTVDGDEEAARLRELGQRAYFFPADVSQAFCSLFPQVKLLERTSALSSGHLFEEWRNRLRNGAMTGVMYLITIAIAGLGTAFAHASDIVKSQGGLALAFFFMATLVMYALELASASILQRQIDEYVEAINEKQKRGDLPL